MHIRHWSYNFFNGLQNLHPLTFTFHFVSSRSFGFCCQILSFHPTQLVCISCCFCKVFTKVLIVGVGSGIGRWNFETLHYTCLLLRNSCQTNVFVRVLTLRFYISYLVFVIKCLFILDCNFQWLPMLFYSGFYILKFMTSVVVLPGVCSTTCNILFIEEF